MSEKFAAGMKVVEEMLGEAVVRSLEASAGSTKFGMQRGPLAVEFVFADLWRAGQATAAAAEALRAQGLIGS